MKTLLCCVLLLVSISLYAVPAYPKSAPRKWLFMEKCSPCHPLGKSLSKVKTKDAWIRIVERMRLKDPKLITAEESAEIAEYLFSIRGVKSRKPIKIAKQRGPKRVTKIPEASTKKDETEAPVTGQGVQRQELSVDQFVKPAVCSTCHTDIFKQWAGSMHSQSFSDPLWQASARLFASAATTDGEISETRMCVKCHVPLGFRSNIITSPKDDFANLPDLVTSGVFCNWCHTISEVKSLGNADYGLTPGSGEHSPSTMLGPFKDSKSDYHQTKFSTLHTQSEFCALCHNVSHVAHITPIESTYDEWKWSPYNSGDPETTVYCQDCHMRQTPEVAATGKTARPDNPGFACSSGPKRRHIPTHYIVGGNTIPGNGFSDANHQDMAVDRLTNAADVEVVLSGDYRKNSMATIHVKVTNSGAGHYLPTGMTEIRQMWLEISVTDKAGRQIFNSGTVDKAGNIDKDSVIFNTLLGNSKGEPVMNIAVADRILRDHRIPPKGYVVEKYSFFIPGYVHDALDVRATLRYRSCSQSFANMTLKEKAPRIPIVNMAQSSVVIDF